METNNHPFLPLGAMQGLQHRVGFQNTKKMVASGFQLMNLGFNPPRRLACNADEQWRMCS